MLDSLYQDLSAAILSIVDDNNNPVFRHIDLWNQQVEYIEKEQPFDTPALFIEFSTIDWQQQLQAAQDAPIEITIHIVTRDLANSAHYFASDGAQQLSHLALPNILFAAIHNTHGTNYGPLVRVRSIPNHNHEHFIDQQEVYASALFAQADAGDIQKAQLLRYGLHVHIDNTR